MKKTACLLLIIVFLPFLLHAETTPLKLRAARNAGSVRIVLEGPDSVIGKGSVARKENNILVTFPGTEISIRAEDSTVPYFIINNETVSISPGDFSGMKVFTLKEPPRLVIDAYPKDEEGAVSVRIKTVVIDPGHGGYESGIVKDGKKEKNTVLDIAQKLGALVNNGPSRGFLTRGSDLFMTLGERVNFANSKGSEVFISLHIGNHRDIVIYTPVITDSPPDVVKEYLHNRGQAEYEKETIALFKALSKAIILAFGEDMLSARPVPYTIISSIESGALIVELPSYEYASYDEEYNSQIAETIYKGLNIYEEAKVR